MEGRRKLVEDQLGAVEAEGTEQSWEYKKEWAKGPRPPK